MRLKSATWTQNSANTTILKARAKDGGAVLASVSWTTRSGYIVGLFRWQAGAISGEADTLLKAQRAARKALREVGDDNLR